MKKSLLILTSTLLLISCGKSSEEIELEKAKLELEKTKLELSQEKNKLNEQKAAEKLKIHESKIQVGINKRKQKLNDALEKLEVEIEKTKNDYNSTNSFQLGRSKSTKEAQLSKINEKLIYLQQNKNGIKKALTELEYSESFAFQENPTNLIQHIFFGAKNKDFSKFQFIVDPYAENSNSAETIKFIKYLPLKDQKEFVEEFSNSRIMGQPKIKGDKAEIEYAYGINSNKLETMTFIKRMDKWYVFSN